MNKMYPTPTKAARARRITAALLTAAAFTGLAACAEEPAGGQLGAAVQATSASNTPASNTPDPAKATLGNSDNYSLTQIVQNNSTVPLTLKGTPTADNGGAVEPGYPTVIAPLSAGTYKATNHGNGVEMFINFATPSGTTLSVDSDVPEYLSNKINQKISGSGLGFDTKNTSIGSGDNPTSTVTIKDCTSGCTTSYTGGGQLG